MTTIVVCSDAHVDWVTYGVSRFRDVADALLEATEEAVRIKADGFAFLGDLTDPDDVSAVLRAQLLMMQVVTILHCGGVTTYLLPGNHDVLEDGTGHTVLDPLAYVNGAVVLKEGLHTGERFNIIALPFLPSSRAYDPADVTRAAVERIHHRRQNGAKQVPTVVLGHLHLPGITPGEETTEMPRGRCGQDVTFPHYEVNAIAGRKVVLNGHYHERQVWTAPDGLKVHVPGSLARLTIDQERHEPGYLVVEV